MASSMWADSAEVVHRVPDLGSFPSDKLLNASLFGSVVDPVFEIAAAGFISGLDP